MRVIRSLAPLFLAWLFLATTQCRAAKDVPFTFRGGMIWLKVDLANRAAPLNFVLDSGAGKSVLNLGTARQLGMKLGAGETVQGVQGRCTAYRVAEFAGRVGATAVPRDVLALDLSSVSAGSGSRIDGLLGADFFRSRVVQIDFGAQKLRILGRADAAACAGQALPLLRRNDAFCLRVGVNGNAPQLMRLDTGYSGSLEWVTAGAKAKQAAGTSVAATGASREPIRTEVLLGTEQVHAVKTGLHSQPIFAGEAGLVGNGILSQFRVTVDAAGSRLFLHRIAR